MISSINFNFKIFFCCSTLVMHRIRWADPSIGSIDFVSYDLNSVVGSVSHHLQLLFGFLLPLRESRLS